MIPTTPESLLRAAGRRFGTRKRPCGRELVDSITDGYGELPNGTLQNPLGVNENPIEVDLNGRWPDDLVRRLIAAGRALSVLNAGISGNRIVQDGASGEAPIYAVYGPSALNRLNDDVLSQSGVSDVIVLEDINDIMKASPRPAHRYSAVSRS